MPKFRKKPVVVDAAQWSQSDPFAHPGVEQEPPTRYFVTTVHEQRAYLVDGDWILPEPKEGRFYPCKPDIFEATYEPAPDAQA